MRYLTIDRKGDVWDLGDHDDELDAEDTAQGLDIDPVFIIDEDEMIKTRDYLNHFIPPTLYVLNVEHKYDSTYSVHQTMEGLYAALYEYVMDYWPEHLEISRAEAETMEEAEAIRIYFDPEEGCGEVEFYSVSTNTLRD